MKISFLIHTVYGIGGTIRTTVNLAEELAVRHEVEIVSAFRHRDVPLFPIDPRVKLSYLVDTRPKSPTYEKGHPDHQQPAEHFPRHEARYKEYSKLTDERVRAHYADSDADVVIGTRPGLVAYLAQFAPQNAVLIGQEHMTFNHHKAALKEELRPHLEAMDAFVTVSEGDAAVWREQMPLPDTRLLCIPNSVPGPLLAPADLSQKLIVAAGRLSKEKQYDVLLKAFAKVVAVHPDWSLRICGWGPDRDRIRRVLHRLRLHDSVQLMGPRSPIEPEWVKGSIAVSTSRQESFGMTLVEAMRCGLPLISTDCDYGPREIVKDGEDGLLVPVGDVAALAASMLKLIEDESLRRTMAEAALRNSRRYDPAAVAKQYADLFAELGAGSAQRSRSFLSSTAGAPDPSPTPVADCVAEADGSLTVTVVSPEAAALKHPGLQLVWTHAEGAAEERAYPLAPNGTSVVPAGEDFADGVWTCHTDSPLTGRRTEVIARSVDQRGAMNVAERMRTDCGVRHLVPYRQQFEHRLVLRSWVRPVHVESGDVTILERRLGTVVERRLALTGRIVGPVEPSGEPTLVLRRAGTGRPSATADTTAPDGTGATDATDGTDASGDEITFHGTREGTRGFSAVIDCESVAALQRSGDEQWELWLRFAPGHEPVQVARLLDDVVQKSDVRVYPEVLVHKQRPLLFARRVIRKLRRQNQRLVKLRLAFDDTNRLVLRVQDR
ncbi:glycosyltransferase family 4 protein [Streptomyces sp. NPDC003860]